MISANAEVQSRRGRRFAKRTLGRTKWSFEGFESLPKVEV